MIDSILMPIIRFVADHPIWIGVAITINLIALHRMVGLMEAIGTIGHDQVPDADFGFTPASLRLLYQEWGQEGCQAYVEWAWLDLFPYMESYAVALAGLALLAARRQGWNEYWALAPFGTMLLDVGETIILQEACRRHAHEPQTSPLPDLVVLAGGFCNRAKWTTFALQVAAVVVAFVVPPAARKKLGKKDSEHH